MTTAAHPLLLAGAGTAFLASCVAQYGPLFHGSAGVCIPVGLPLVFAAAWFVWQGKGEEEVDEDGEDESPSSDIS
jgi:hypothetical protein